MTKHDVVLLTVICHLFVLNIFPDLFVTAASTTTETPNETSPKTIKLGNLIGKGKLHSYHTIKSLLEESHPDYDDEYAGGKSLAFLRLGRSSEEEHSTDEALRKEIDDAIKSSGIQHKHNITKRSNLPDGEDDSEVDVDNPNTIDDKNNDEVTSDLSDIESEVLDEKEKEEYVPYEESATLSLPDFNSEEENSEALDLNTSPYLSSHPDFARLGKRNSFSLRPMKRNNFAFRPMKRNNFAFRPMKRNNFAFKPMKRNNFAFRPMKRNNFAFRPMKKNNFAFRPMKRNNFALRPMKRNNFALRPMKRSGNSFAFRPVKKQGNNFALRPMKRTSSPQSRKENFLRYGKRDSFALRPMKREGSFAFRPMKRPGDSFVLRPMKKGSIPFCYYNSYYCTYLKGILGSSSKKTFPEKRDSFSFRPMKKGRARFQLRPMKRSSDDFNFWKDWRPKDEYQSLEDFGGIENLVKRGMDAFSLRPM